MYARVVRFTDVTAEQITRVTDRVNESDGPPPGVDASGIRILVDESQSTAVVILFFETEEAMRKGAEIMDQMDPSETPGTRGSVDLCEVKIDRDMS
jgi:hypothetical protein